MSSTQEELEPIDVNRCQAETRKGSFMTFGLPQLVRCENKPSWIGVGVREGKFYGAMSLCDDCKKVCEIREPGISYQKLLGGKNGTNILTITINQNRPWI